MSSEKKNNHLLKCLSDRANSCCEVVLFLTIASMTLLTLLQIICRMFFDALTWSEELTCYLLMLATFCGTTIGVYRKAHIAVIFFIEKLPLKARQIAVIFSSSVGILFFSVIGGYGAVLAWEERRQYASALDIPIGLVYLVFPITALIALLHLFAAVVEKKKGTC